MKSINCQLYNKDNTVVRNSHPLQCRMNELSEMGITITMNEFLIPRLHYAAVCTTGCTNFFSLYTNIFGLYQSVACRVASIKHVDYLLFMQRTHHTTGLANCANETADSGQSGAGGRRDVITHASHACMGRASSSPDQGSWQTKMHTCIVSAVE
jgi:hypothetical protein